MNLARRMEHPLTLSSLLGLDTKTLKMGSRPKATMDRLLELRSASSSNDLVGLTKLVLLPSVLVLAFALAYALQKQYGVDEDPRKIAGVAVTLSGAFGVTVFKRLAQVEKQRRLEANKTSSSTQPVTPKLKQLSGVVGEERADLLLRRRKENQQAGATPSWTPTRLSSPLVVTPSSSVQLKGGDGARGAITGLGASVGGGSVVGNIATSESARIAGGVSTTSSTPGGTSRGRTTIGTDIGTGAMTTSTNATPIAPSTTSFYDSPNSLILQASRQTPQQKQQESLVARPSPLSVVNTPGAFPPSSGLNFQTPQRAPQNPDPNMLISSPYIGTPGGGASQTPLQQTSQPTRLGPPSSQRQPQQHLHEEDHDKAFWLLQKLKIEEDTMEDWVSNLRKVLREVIVDMVLKPLDEIHAKLRSDHQTQQWFPRSLLEWEDKTTDLNEVLHKFEQALANQPMNRELIRTELKTRKQLEKFFVVCRHDDMAPFPKAYVLKRLRTLVKTEDMSNFNWNCGESFEDKPWNCDGLPTDAEILFHVFCVYMDRLLNRESGDDVSFARIHVREARKTAVTQLQADSYWGFLNCGDIVEANANFWNAPFFGVGQVNSSMFQQGNSVFRPHFKLVVRGEVWEVKAQRSNLFRAIVLFLYSLKREKTARVQEIVGKVLTKTMN